VSISKLPGKPTRYRAQVYCAATGKNVSVARVLGLSPASFPTKAAAKAAREQARQKLHERHTGSLTVQAWADLWTSNPRYRRPKESTNITNATAIRKFVRQHGQLPLEQVTRKLATQWLREGGRDYAVQSLRVMFADAVNDDLIPANPFSRVGVTRGKGNADKQPPSPEQVQRMIRLAGELVSPYFAGWLAVAAYTGMRPGEVDALRWDAVDLQANRVHVREQYSAQSRSFTLPKNGQRRTIVLTPPARDALVGLPVVSEFCFVNFRGDHYGKSGRTYPWAMVRAAAGLQGTTLYVATRHFCGWWLVNEYGMHSEDVAIQLGHEDGGELVRTLYGHRDRDLALGRIEEALMPVQRNERRAA
jgi:integrase